MKRFIIFLLIILAVFIFFIYFKNRPENIDIILKGKDVITITQGNKYTEPGFRAISGKKDVTDKVQVKKNIDTNNAGTYEVIYFINSKDKVIQKKRFIKVIKPKEVTYKDDYDKIDNTSRGWWATNRFDGSRPLGGADINELKKYNAHYLGDDKKTIYLTFDEGSLDTYLKEIVAVLDKNGVKATFFLCKKYMLVNRELIKQMVENGHTIANHTSSHLNMPSLATRENFNKFLDEIKSVEKTYYEITGKEMEKVYRDPKGEWSFRDLQIIKDLGYKNYFYSAYYYDFDSDVTKEKALNELSKRVHNGAIYLIHPKNKGNYLAMDSFIKEMKKQGYTFDLVKNIK